MSIDIIKPNALQMQQVADKPTEFSPVTDSLTFALSPSTGTITVEASTAVEIAIGASALTGRKYITIHNSSNDVAVRVGDSGVTQKSGYLLEPKGTVVIADSDDASEIEVYAISTGYAVELEVIES